MCGNPGQGGKQAAEWLELPEALAALYPSPAPGWSTFKTRVLVTNVGHWTEAQEVTQVTVSQEASREHTASVHCQGTRTMGAGDFQKEVVLVGSFRKYWMWRRVLGSAAGS